MSSLSLKKWKIVRTASLDEMENAHRSVGGSRRGRRFATQQLNRAYAVLLSSEFQGFCRDLHSEGVDFLISKVDPSSLSAAFRAEFFLHRQLDNKNPTPSAIGADFNRLGTNFWDEVLKKSKKNLKYQTALEDLNQWRNAIAHNDFDPEKLGRETLPLIWVQYWRKACDRLAKDFNIVLRDYLTTVTGTGPW